MSECIFCAVVDGSAPGSFVYQDEQSVAFLDLFPVHPGHTLVVPREHIEDLVRCPSGLAAHLFSVCAHLAPAIVEATNADGFNVWTANGRSAGQEIFHLHLHVLPRFNDDTFGLRFPKGYPAEGARTDLDAMAATIRRRL